MLGGKKAAAAIADVQVNCSKSGGARDATGLRDDNTLTGDLWVNPYWESNPESGGRVFSQYLLWISFLTNFFLQINQQSVRHTQKHHHQKRKKTFSFLLSAQAPSKERIQFLQFFCIFSHKICTGSWTSHLSQLAPLACWKAALHGQIESNRRLFRCWWCHSKILTGVAAMARNFRPFFGVFLAIFTKLEPNAGHTYLIYRFLCKLGIF